MVRHVFNNKVFCPDEKDRRIPTPFSLFPYTIANGFFIFVWDTGRDKACKNNTAGLGIWEEQWKWLGDGSRHSEMVAYMFDHQRRDKDLLIG